MTRLVPLASLAGVAGHALSVLFILAIVVLLAVLLFSVIPAIARDQVADRKSARRARRRADTVALKVRES